MRKGTFLLVVTLFLAGMIVWATSNVWATEKKGAEAAIEHIVDVQKYNRSIHVMAMLLVGFGFLMVFVKKYGRSAVTATYLLVSIAVPVYIFISSKGLIGEPKSEVDTLLLAEFAGASLLICAGAPLGRLKMSQYLLLGLLFTPCYMINEWILLESGLGLIPKGGFVDTGGSILIHAFGALFGLAVVMTMTTKEEFTAPIEADHTSDQFSMLGSMVLWLFWPSFCAGLVEPKLVPFTAVNVFLALCGATIATYIVSANLRGKIAIGDIANAALAGGVGVGATCDTAGHPAAFIIGILAGTLSTIGFVSIQPALQNWVKGIDTCGVTNLHGWPGLMGGIIAAFLVPGITANNQFKGIIIAIVLALVTGYVTGQVLAYFGRRRVPYTDEEEILA
ncbi:MAG TPA: ammonium transporter [Candidatus Hypogeohydataceae bacterium YC41]